MRERGNKYDNKRRKKRIIVVFSQKTIMEFSNYSFRNFCSSIRKVVLLI